MNKVKDLLEAKSRDLFTIEQTQSVADAISLMMEREIGCLIVVDAGKPIGMFTERDVLRVWLTRPVGKRSHEIPLATVMTQDPIVVSPDDSLDYIISVMIRNRIRHLPVVEGAKVVAVLSMRDVVNSLVTNLKVEIHHLEEQIRGGYQ